MYVIYIYNTMCTSNTNLQMIQQGRQPTANSSTRVWALLFCVLCSFKVYIKAINPTSIHYQSQQSGLGRGLFQLTGLRLTLAPPTKISRASATPFLPFKSNFVGVSYSTFLSSLSFSSFSIFSFSSLLLYSLKI